MTVTIPVTYVAFLGEYLERAAKEPDFRTTLQTAVLEEADFVQVINSEPCILLVGNEQDREEFLRDRASQYEILCLFIDEAYESGNLDDALLFALAACNLQPGNAQTYETAGTLLIENAAASDPKTAKKYLDMACRMSEMGLTCGENIGCMINLAYIHDSRDELPQAELWLHEILKIEPQNAWAQENLARTLYFQDRFADALEFIDGLQAPAAEESQVLNLKASWVKVLSVDPENAKAHNNISFYLARRGRAEAALHYAEEAVRLAPENPISHCNLARCFARQGALEEARDEYRWALALTSPQDVILQKKLRRTGI